MNYTPVDELARDIASKIETIDKNMEFVYRLLDSRSASLDKILDAIPPCPAHGNRCIPHALLWIEKMRIAQPL